MVATCRDKDLINIYVYIAMYVNVIRCNQLIIKFNVISYINVILKQNQQCKVNQKQHCIMSVILKVAATPGMR